MSVSLSDEKTHNREIAALEEAMNTFGLQDGYVITSEETEDIELTGGKQVHVIPYYRWTLQYNCG